MEKNDWKVQCGPETTGTAQYIYLIRSQGTSSAAEQLRIEP